MTEPERAQATAGHPSPGVASPAPAGLAPAGAASSSATLPPARERGLAARVRRALREPNPVWQRELVQAARLRRTPIILAVVTIVTALLVTTVGGLAASSTAPAMVGTILFHTFFSVAFAVVSWVGPGVAAMTIASERSGRTWEALVLTGMEARAIARGKYAAALTHLGLYLVMLAPVGAVPFLFGGVTAVEVLLAFALLGLFASLAVGYGLAVSSAVANPSTAMLVTVPVAVVVSLFSYGTFGVGGSVLAHHFWPAVPEGPPVWLPTALVVAPLGLDYLLYLVLYPVAAIGLAAWLAYETTVANLGDPSDDRASGLHVWFIAGGLTVLGLGLSTAFEVDAGARVAALGGTQAALLVFGALGVMLFCADPPLPSRRVTTLWQRSGTPRWRRLLGPGTLRAMLLPLGVAGGGTLCVSALASLLALRAAPGLGRTDALQLAVLAAYGCAFLTLLAGVAALVRVRSETPMPARLVLLGVGLSVLALPWIAVAITGVAWRTTSRSLVLGAPSPGYAFVMLRALERPTDAGANAQLAAGAAAILGWLLLGLGLLWRAQRFTRKAPPARDH